MSIIKNALIFTGGFAAGVTATYFIATRYLGLEIVWETSDNDISEEARSTDNEGEQEQESIELITDKYMPITENDKYVDYSKLESEPVAEEDLEVPPEVEAFGDPEATPYLIESSEYGTDYEYDEIELYWWDGNKLLTDCWNYPVEDIERTVGNDAVEKCREGDSDVVYVKNDRLKAYYEILKQVQDYPGISG